MTEKEVIRIIRAELQKLGIIPTQAELDQLRSLQSVSNGTGDKASSVPDATGNS